MHLDWTIRMGDVLTIAAILASVSFSGWRAVREFRRRMGALEAELREVGLKLGMVWTWFKREHDLENGIVGHREDPRSA